MSTKNENAAEFSGNTIGYYGLTSSFALSKAKKPSRSQRKEFKTYTRRIKMLDVLLSATTLLDATPAAAAFFGFMGCSAALVFACMYSNSFSFFLFSFEVVC